MDYGNIILASASPRRRELLGLITDNFTVISANADETYPESTPTHDIPLLLAEKKAMSIDSDRIIISGDTIVALGSDILGKPKDRTDAFRMLRLLSGQTHEVISGVCIRQGNRKALFNEITSVTFYPLSDKKIEQYIDCGESFDKAGAYGIQGSGALLVRKICGDYFNVVGLPVARLSRELEKFTG